MMLENYFPILLFILVGLAVGGGAMACGWLLAPNRPDSEKLSTMNAVSRLSRMRA